MEEKARVRLKKKQNREAPAPGRLTTKSFTTNQESVSRCMTFSLLDLSSAASSDVDGRRLSFVLFLSISSDPSLGKLQLTATS